MIRHRNASALAGALVVCLLAGPSHAGGLYLSTFGTPSMGTASAGANAIAEDASTAFHNPAGMTRLEDHQLNLGLAPGFGTVKFNPKASSPSGGGNGGQQGGFLPISSNQYVHKLSERWRLGLSLLSISGAALDPSNHWAGRNEITKVSLFSLTLAPTVAVRVTDWLSVGAGVAITYGKLDFDLRAPVLMEPTIKLDNLDDWAAAPVAAVLLEPTPGLRFGIGYQGETKLKLDGRIKLRGADAGLDVTLPLAQAVRGSVYWEACESIALMASAGWEDWSVADNLPASVAAGSAKVPLGFRDTWYVAGGVRYHLNDAWTLQTGLRYDSSALKDSDRTVAFPVDRVYTFGAGTLYDWSENLRIGLTFVWADLGKAPVKTSFVRGSYSSNSLFLFGLSLSWKKLPWSGRATL